MLIAVGAGDGGSARRPSGAGEGGLRPQDIVFGRLRNGAGAGVVVEIRGRGPVAGRWLVRGGRFLVETEGEVPASERLARVRVNLPAGVHRFEAWVRPLPGGCLEVLPHQSIQVEQRRRAVRVAVRLPGILNAPPVIRDAAVTVCDLSATGVGFVGAVQLAVGDRCRILLACEPGVSVGPLSGTVVRCGPVSEGFRYGVRLDADAGFSERLYAWLSALRRAEAGRGTEPRPGPGA